MIEKYRKRIEEFFDIQEQENCPSLNLFAIFLWIMAAGIVGGIVPFIWHTNNSLMIASLSALIFIILTAKPVLKKIIKKYD